MTLNGRNALVTGGTRGIGRAIVLALAEAGANVVTCYRQESDAVDLLRKELAVTAGEHHVLKADVGEQAELAEFVRAAAAHLGTVDIVVHNAGAITHVPFDKLSLEGWNRVVDTNLTAAFQLTQEVIPALSESASIIYVGSKVAMVGVPMRAHYTAAKAGMVGLARSLSKELGARGIRVNVVAPGIIDTSDPDRMPPEEYNAMQERLDAYRKRVPLGRLGRSEDIAAAVLFLSGDGAAFINGETLNVDGGM
ncbi:3-oxoacyl-ACP reductase FabG [Actinomadura barringtoniae]|uniref:3-oxoacyl-ACP reductase FabG n=1 Tax=Actinomadura barringtoniae TaxID=1427535 RepID=A0A939T1X6_9ACTN|nr:3-oxoacyl-ACP reductase FabG [Actinomadura barringtoniae]MBO2445583.1 3-oxoacyl-ACP reductase FabG [Actinomadura barringtoniae]